MNKENCKHKNTLKSDQSNNSICNDCGIILGDGSGKNYEDYVDGKELLQSCTICKRYISTVDENVHITSVGRLNYYKHKQCK